MIAHLAQVNIARMRGPLESADELDAIDVARFVVWRRSG
jgi:hypothetical protein